MFASSASIRRSYSASAPTVAQQPREFSAAKDSWRSGRRFSPRPSAAPSSARSPEPARSRHAKNRPDTRTPACGNTSTARHLGDRPSCRRRTRVCGDCSESLVKGIEVHHQGLHDLPTLAVDPRVHRYSWSAAKGAERRRRPLRGVRSLSAWNSKLPARARRLSLPRSNVGNNSASNCKGGPRCCGAGSARCRCCSLLLTQTNILTLVAAWDCRSASSFPSATIRWQHTNLRVVLLRNLIAGLTW